MNEIEVKNIPAYAIDHLAEGLQKAREFRGISLKDSSRLLGIPANKLANYEKGKYIPPLNEVEALSYIYSVPLAALFSPEDYPDIFKIPNAAQLNQLLQIRKRIISTSLQIAHDKTGKPLREIAKLAGISSPKLKRFLQGEIDIPFNDLQRIARVLELDLNTLIDSESPIGQWQVLQQKKITYANLPENARDFLNKKENWPYMEVVEKMRALESGKLESIAASIRNLADLSSSVPKSRD